MEWKIIDRKTGDTFVSKTGKRLEGLDEKTMEAFKKFHSVKGDLSNFEIVQEMKGPTSYEDRRKFFRNTSPELAEMFPNLAENYMMGKRGAVENIPAAIGDVASYLPRMAFALSNAAVGNGEGYNLGRRSYDKGTGFVQGVGRSPSLIPGMGFGPAVSKSVPAASNFVGKLLNLGKGAGTGAVFGGADAALNNRDPEFSDYLIGSALAGGAELGMGAVSAILKKAKSLLSSEFARSEKELDRALASALGLGNTDRMMTQEEFSQFVSDPNNVRLLNEVKNAVTSGRNMSPFVTDRGRSLEQLIEEAAKKGEKALEGQKILENSYGNSIPEGLSPTKERIARQDAALRRKGLETYSDKTIFKPGKHDLKNDAFPTEYPEARVFSNTPGKTKTDRYQSSLEFNVEKHADKWDKIGSAVENFRINKKGVMPLNKKTPISEDEIEFLNKVETELKRDNKILSKYNANRLIEKNRFLRDVNPFEKNDLYYKELQKLTEKHSPDGFSEEFVNKMRDLTATARMQGEFAMDRLRSGLEYKNSSAVERAFAYASGDNAKYDVVKNYKNAVDDFADALSDYADNSIANSWRKNAKDEVYKVEPERMKKYAFSYLKKVQDVLRKKGSLTAKDITGLYGDATKVNDKTVQDAILKLLRRLGVDEKAVSNFEKEARDYVMLNKARSRLRKNAVDESNPLKGTNYGWLYPQEGVNTKNILGSKLNEAFKNAGEKLRSNVISTFDLGKPVRGLIYSGGSRDREK